MEYMLLFYQPSSDFQRIAPIRPRRADVLGGLDGRTCQAVQAVGHRQERRRPAAAGDGDDPAA